MCIQERQRHEKYKWNACNIPEMAEHLMPFMLAVLSWEQTSYMATLHIFISFADIHNYIFHLDFHAHQKESSSPVQLHLLFTHILRTVSGSRTNISKTAVINHASYHRQSILQLESFTLTYVWWRPLHCGKKSKVLECMLTKPELQTLSFFDMTKFKPGKIPTNLRSGHLQYLLQHSMTYLMLHTPLIQQTWEPLSHSSTLKCKSMSWWLWVTAPSSP